MAVQELSRIADLPTVMLAVKRAARDLTGADGVTFVLREGDTVFYADEEAIGPLWKGSRFPVSACISGWAMVHRESVVVEDIYKDQRVPLDAYRPTFVKSLAMVPIRKEEPVGAIGAYWASRHMPSTSEVALLESLAASAAVAVANAELISTLRIRERELEAALAGERSARAQVEGALQQRDEFLGAASHELRTPLTALQLDVASFVRSKRDDASDLTTRRLERMEAQLHKLDNLIGQLLDASRIILRRMSLDPGVLDAAEVIAEVVDRFQQGEMGAQAAAPIAVIGTGPLIGCWDRLRLDQLISNLLSNGLKYGLGRPVTLDFKADDQELTLAVSDQGMGIPVEEQSRIFDRFFRGGSAASLPGLGLGLWIAREIVNAHGGALTLESAPAQGATFTVKLPRRLGAIPDKP
jgi:signal transduction histidine kinase